MCKNRFQNNLSDSPGCGNANTRSSPLTRWPGAVTLDIAGVSAPRRPLYVHTQHLKLWPRIIQWFLSAAVRRLIIDSVVSVCIRLYVINFCKQDISTTNSCEHYSRHSLHTVETINCSCRSRSRMMAKNVWHEKLQFL